MAERKNRLDAVANVADSQERSAAQDLAKVLAALEAVRNQITQLQSYCEEYQTTDLNGLHNQAVFTDRRVFLSRLNQAILALQEQEKDLDKKRLTLLAKWKSLKNKVKSMEKYNSRLEHMDKLKVHRLEQREVDDIVGRNTRYPAS